MKQKILSLRLVFIGLCIVTTTVVSTVSASSMDAPYWNPVGVIQGEYLAGPIVLFGESADGIIFDGKYVDGSKYKVADPEILAQPGDYGNWFYNFLVQDDGGNYYLGTAGQSVAFIDMYRGTCLNKIFPCGREFIETKITSAAYAAQCTDVFELTTRKMGIWDASSENSLFLRDHEGMNPRADSYVVLIRLP